MSTTSLRALAVTVAAVVAVLTGVATGLLSGKETCITPAAMTPPAATTQAAPAQSAPSNGGNLGGPEQGPTTPVQQAPAAPPVTQSPVCSTEAFGVKPAATAFVGALFVGAALLLLLLMASKRRPPVPVSAPPVPVSAPPSSRSGTGGQADVDRKALVQACIYVRDRVTSKALGDRLGAALREAGVSILEPTGVRFDPAHHEAGGSVPSTDPAKVGTIAAVEVPGYADRNGRVLRAPVVTVYQPAGQTTQAGQASQNRREPRQ